MLVIAFSVFCIRLANAVPIALSWFAAVSTLICTESAIISPLYYKNWATRDAIVVVISVGNLKLSALATPAM